MFRENAGRLFVVGAGAGCLVLLIFVVLPMMNEPAPPLTQDEIVAEVLGPEKPEDDEGEGEVAGADDVIPVPSPLVGIRKGGGEVAVIFPASEPDVDVPPVVAEEGPAEEIGLPQILSAEDVAEARAALEGVESEPVATAEPDSVDGAEEDEAVAGVPPEPEGPAPVSSAVMEDREAAPVVPSEPEVQVAGDGEATEPVITVGSKDERSIAVEAGQDSQALEEDSEVTAADGVLPVERIPDAGDGGPDWGPAAVDRPAVRRSEFDLPVDLGSRTPREVSHPSGGVPDSAVAEAAQAGDPQPGLPPRSVRAGIIVPGTLRGVMGYRLPLISRQEVPDQIVSGVLIPAHTTFVILREGSWELVNVSAEEVVRLQELAASQQAEVSEPEPEKQKGWALLRMFRKRQAPADE